MVFPDFRSPAALVYWMAMRRSLFGLMIAIGALWLGVVSFVRGQFWLGLCFLLLAVLRAGTMLWGRKRTPKQDAEIRLGIMQAPSVLRYPKLPDHLKSQLDAIKPSVDGDLEYYPCLVRLKDGSEVDRVFLVSEAPYIQHWGMYPSHEHGEAEIPVTDVASLTESPSRADVHQGPNDTKSTPGYCWCIYSE
jgi:hypothetical protein